MKWVSNIVAVLLILVGIIWILQGVGVLPGSFMSGNIQYAFLGAILDIIGIAILIYANRRSKATTGDDNSKMSQ